MRERLSRNVETQAKECIYSSRMELLGNKSHIYSFILYNFNLNNNNNNNDFNFLWKTPIAFTCIYH